MAKAKKKEIESAPKNKNGILSGVWTFVIWLTGILVSLAVGFGMIDGVLTIRWMSLVVTQSAGWIVVILTVLGVLLKLIDKLSGR